MKKEEIIEELGIRFEACEETLEDAAEAILKLQQQEVSECKKCIELESELEAIKTFHKLMKIASDFKDELIAKYQKN